MMCIFFRLAKSDFAYVGLYTTMSNSGNVNRNDTDVASVYKLSIAADGKMDIVDQFKAGPDVSWIEWHPTKDIVYALSESEGTVSAFKSDSWLFINKIKVGDGPVYLSVDNSGNFLFVADYGAGICAVYKIEKDGSLGELTDTHTQGPGTHSVVQDPKNDKYVFSPVLGLDKVNQWVFGTETGKLTPNPVADSLPMKAFTGPRHMRFHPTLPLVYIADEGNSTTNSTLTICQYSREKGVLTIKETIDTLYIYVDPTDMYPAEILVSSDGNYVYVSNRDASTQKRDTISVFHVDGEKLSLEGEARTGWYPRSMSFCADESILLVGNQKDSSIFAFMVGAQNGTLSRTPYAHTFSSNVAFVGVASP